MKTYNFDQHFHKEGDKFKLNDNVKQTELNKMLKVMGMNSLPLDKKHIVEHYFNMYIQHGYYQKVMNMIEKNKIYNMNCHDLINDMINENFKVDSIISQPP